MRTNPIGEKLLLELHSAAIDAKLESSRDALMSGINSAHVASIPRDATPSAQLLLDLRGHCVELADGSVPLKTWLKNALSIAGERLDVTCFKQALTVLGYLIPASTPHNAFDFTRVRAGISTKLREDILTIARGVSWQRDTLGDAYFASAPPALRYLFDCDHDPDLIDRMLARLASMMDQHDGTHPILRFALHLAKIAPKSVKTDLSLLDWFHAAADHLNFDPAKRDALQEEVNDACVEARELHLVVIVGIDPDVANQYTVRAYRVLVRPGKAKWGDDEDIVRLPGDAERLCTIEDLSGRLKEFVLLVGEDLRRSNNDLTIELVVPFEFLSCDADRWEPKTELADTVPFGVEYNVVIRSWERYPPRGARMRARWEEKWRQIQQPGKDRAPACHREEADARVAKLFSGPACVALMFVPSLDNSGRGAPVLRNLIEAGTPIAIWPRQPSPDDGSLQSWIERLTTAEPPITWPTVVKEYRRTGQDRLEQTHPGRHLTVLMDDPNKVVAETRFVAPPR
jgi:hypothetical protein